MKGERTITSSMRALDAWFASMTVEEVDRPLCQEYAADRAALGRAPSTIVTELAILSAALNEAVSAGMIRHAPKIWTPKPSPRRERWLTRDEAARLMRACRRLGHERVLRLVMIGLYTGSRADRIYKLRWKPNAEGGWIDTRAGMLYRKPPGETATSKKAPTVRLSRKLLRLARGWEKDGAEFVIHHNGKPVTGGLRVSWPAALAEAGIAGMTQHGLRHTAITWTMQRGAPVWEVAGYFGLSQGMVETVYGHHHPDHMKGVLDALE